MSTGLGFYGSLSFEYGPDDQEDADDQDPQPGDDERETEH